MGTDQSSNRRASSSDRCYCDRARLQAPNVVMESSKFSPTSLSEMKTDDVKNSYCVLKQLESTLEERTIPTLLKSIGVGIILSSTVSLF
jgi:hypothetical protein